jgi:hypothetical protein
MPKTKVRLVKGDKRTIECRVWSDWMSQAALLLDRHQDLWGGDDDPFSYNETASVAFLAAAGALAGHVALADCCTEKLPPAADTSKARKRRRHGRGDLWVHTERRGWAFEFKQRMSVGVSRSTGRLKSQTKAARECARQVIRKVDGEPVAGLIVSLYWVEDDDAARRAADEIERFAHENVAFCWRLAPPAGRRQTYLLFDPV